MPRVYLDYHAAAPLDPRVRAQLRELGEVGWANPSSVHAEGRASRALLEQAREQVAAALGAAPADLVLTAGGTEACNQAVLGLLGHAPAPAHVITTTVEHPAVAEPLARLEAAGRIQLTRLAVPHGQPPEPSQLLAALQPNTRLVAIQSLNHETGTLFPIAAYAEHCQRAGVPLFVDATQALGKLPLDVSTLGADLVAIASHKIGGPAGSGALWVRRGRDLESLLTGGGQERGRRAGTPDVLSQLGFGLACALLPERLSARARIGQLRDRLEAWLLEHGAALNAAAGPRSESVTNVWFAGRRSETLVAALDLEGIAVSAGAACSSGKSEPSPVLLAMHADEPARAASSIRFSFGPELAETDVDFAIACCAKVLSRPLA
jgi:cysteine desulfurase